MPPHHPNHHEPNRGIHINLPGVHINFGPDHRHGHHPHGHHPHGHHPHEHHHHGHHPHGHHPHGHPPHW